MRLIIFERWWFEDLHVFSLILFIVCFWVLFPKLIFVSFLFLQLSILQMPQVLSACVMLYISIIFFIVFITAIGSDLLQMLFDVLMEWRFLHIIVVVFVWFSGIFLNFW
jgi:hypothetical protein